MSGKYIRTPEWRAKRSEISKKIWTNPEIRAKLEKAARNRSPEWRMKQVEAAKNRSTETRIKQSESVKKRFSNSEERIKQSERVKERFSDPKERIKLSKLMKEISNDLKWKIKVSKTTYEGHIKSKARNFLLQLENNVPLDIENRDEIINKLQTIRHNL
jgi:hypothetical protein